MRTALGENLDRIEIAIGIKRIAGVIAADRDRDAGSRELAQQGHPAPARRAPFRAVLQIHVAHRQRHHRNTGGRYYTRATRAVRIGGWRRQACSNGRR